MEHEAGQEPTPPEVPWRALTIALAAAAAIVVVVALALGGSDDDVADSPDIGSSEADGGAIPDPSPTQEPTATARPTAIPTTLPTGDGGIEFPGYPFVNDRGTYFSTLGAPPEMMGWIRSEELLWNQPLPDDTPKVDNSDTIAFQIAETVRGQRFVDYPSGIETGANAPYVLLVDADREDFVRIRSDCFGQPQWGWGWSGEQFEEYVNEVYPGRDGVPMPAEFAMDPDDGDFAVTIYDYRNDILFDFWQFKSSTISGAEPTACWGGVIRDFSSQSDGVFPYPMGGTAAGTSAPGLTITLEDLRQGVIDHAIGVSYIPIFNELHLDVIPSASYPGVRNDGVCAREPAESWDREFYDSVMLGVEAVENCLREGQRLRLPADFDVSGIEHPVARMVATAVRDYGIVVQDYGGCFCLQGESGRVVTENGMGEDPWLTANGQSAEWQILTQIPWELVEILPVDWGEPPDHERACIDNYLFVESDPTCERTVPPRFPG